MTNWRAPRVLAVAAAMSISTVVVSGCSLLDWEPPPKPVSNWSVQDARAFNEFDIYWLGRRYEGLALTSMRRTIDGDDVKHASFSYGDPNFSGDAASGSWVAPLEVDIQPYCGYPPEEFLSFAGKYVESDVTGIQIRGVDGYLERYSSTSANVVLWTGPATVYLHTWRTDLDIEQAARELIPISDDSGAPKGPLPPPTSTEC